MTEGQARLTFAVLRKRAGLTQRQLADALGVTITTVSSWERGTQVPRLTFAQVKKLMDVLSCSIDELAEAAPTSKSASDDDGSPNPIEDT